jgi:hypothetical protein
MEKGWPLESIQRIRPSPSPRRSFERIGSSHAQTSDAKDTTEWPAHTHTLEERQRDWTIILYDTVIILLPILLLAKAIIAAVLGNSQGGGQDVDTTPIIVSYMVYVNDQLVTFFTIVFATIVATLVRRYALWKAQKGATIAQLEQLHSSISLPKTLSLVWSLRSWTVTSFCLIMLWFVSEYHLFLP